MRLGPTIVLIALASAALAGPAATPAPEAAAAATVAAPKKSCLSQSETREEIKAHGLKDAFAALKSAAQHYKAEALSAKLCRIDDEFVYEIALLRRNQYFHALVDATTGKLVEPKRPTAPPPPKT